MDSASAKGVSIALLLVSGLVVRVFSVDSQHYRVCELLVID